MPHRAGLIWVKFPTVRSLTRVKCPGIARGGMGGFGIDWYISYAFYSTWEDCLSLIGRVMLSLWVWTIKIAWPVTYKINLRCVSWIPKSVVGYAKATGTFGTKSLTNSLAFSRKSYLSRWNVNKWNAINSIQCLRRNPPDVGVTSGQKPCTKIIYIVLQTSVGLF